MLIPISIPKGKQSLRASWFSASCAATMLFVSGSGCRQRAYTELYIENMASEIRMLEDRVYEYDDAYLQLENEVDQLRLKNAMLEERLRNDKTLDKPPSGPGIQLSPRSPNGSSRRLQPSSPSTLLAEPETYHPPEPIVIPAEPSSSDRYEVPSILMQDSEVLTPPPSARNLPSNSSNESRPSEVLKNPPPALRTPAPPPTSPATERTSPFSSNPNPGKADGERSLLPTEQMGQPRIPGTNPSDSQPQLPPAILPEPRASRTKGATGPKEELVEQVVMPESMVRQAQQPATRGIGNSPLQSQPSVSRPSGLIQAPLPLQIRPETNADRGSGANAVPALLPKAIQNMKDSPTRSDLHRSRVKLPEGSKVQWASANEESSGNSQVTHAVARSAQPEIDSRVVDISFHPTLCRGHNFDSEPGDDGLYMVLCPTNEAGQVINSLGNLTVIVEEDAGSNKVTRIGAWEFSKDQLEEMLTPIGTSQGFHLSLPWQDKQPEGSQVVAYVRYSLENGRTLVNRRSIVLKKPKAGRSVWTPR